jgi:hypothetical protein
VGYRAEWLRHDGKGTRHLEVILHAFDREVRPDRPVRLLEVGVENGGSMEVWEKVLPPGSEVLGIDRDRRCATIGVPVLTGDVHDQRWLREALAGQRFDVIVQDTGTQPEPGLWPFLSTGGLFIVEGQYPEWGMGLAGALLDGDSWLPAEEVLRVTCWPGALVVEKRHPRAVPYLEVVIGEEYPLVSAEDMQAAGIKRVLP